MLGHLNGLGNKAAGTDEVASATDLGSSKDGKRPTKKRTKISASKVVKKIKGLR